MSGTKGAAAYAFNDCFNDSEFPSRLTERKEVFRNEKTIEMWFGVGFGGAVILIRIM